MNAEINPSVKRLLEGLCRQLEEHGYSASVVGRARYLSERLSRFMERHRSQEYDAAIGAVFVEEYYREHGGANEYMLFIDRMNAVMNGGEFVVRRKLSAPAILPPGLEYLLSCYLEHGAESGFRESSIRLYGKICRWFLKYLAEDGVTGGENITTATISRACLKVTSNYYFSAIHTFLHYLAEAGILERDYSRIVPYFKRPQPIPSVYSPTEIQGMEAASRVSYSYGKRNYAMLLLATRLGIRAGDIATMTFDELDFEHETIRLAQQKTGEMLELPMLPVIRKAMLDYIQTERGISPSKYVFLTLNPPYDHVSVPLLGKLVQCALRDADIDPARRKQGPHAMRSSLASSMVNDDVPYEVVRRVLGHTDVNAIKSYARLDVEQLAKYTIEPPKATGNFAMFLSGEVLAG